MWWVVWWKRIEPYMYVYDFDAIMQALPLSPVDSGILIINYSGICVHSLKQKIS